MSSGRTYRTGAKRRSDRPFGGVPRMPLNPVYDTSVYEVVTSSMEMNVGLALIQPGSPAMVEDVAEVLQLPFNPEIEVRDANGEEPISVVAMADSNPALLLLVVTFGVNPVGPVTMRFAQESPANRTIDGCYLGGAGVMGTEP